MVQKETLKKIHIVCGPTAAGKTAQAVRLAREMGGEIVSADSGQIYRGLDIGTAKPTPEELSGVPIHLVDILDPSERFSAALFRELADEKIAGIFQRKREVIVCGGTGLYLRALVGGLFEGPESDPSCRQLLEDRLQKEGTEALHEELRKVDPKGADLIPHGNRRRLVRALEVYHLTRRPISEFWEGHRFAERRYESEVTLLLPPRDELYRQIEVRVEAMIARGWLEETRGLLKKWGSEAPGLQIIGYKELVAHLQGKMDFPRAVALIKQHTRNYAKRQITWFRNQNLNLVG